MALRASARLSGAVTAEKGDDLSDLTPGVLESLKSRGLVYDDGKDNPAAPVATPAKPKADKE
ncbi:hypothetical protein D3C76_489930 [compost metagenome]